MTSDELHKLQRVQFTLARQVVQGVVVGDRRKKVVVMRDHGKGDWRPLFIPLHLLQHVDFQYSGRPFMPIYNPIMEQILEQARQGFTDCWDVL